MSKYDDRYEDREDKYDDDRCEYDNQRHVHEFLWSTEPSGKVCHTHRFCGVTEEAIPVGC